MKGTILNLNGTALDGLVRVEDFGAKNGRHEFLVHVAHVTPLPPKVADYMTRRANDLLWRMTQRSTRWTPLPPKLADYTTEGPDGLLWPTWKIPVERIDLATLATRADPRVDGANDRTRTDKGTHPLWIKTSDRRSNSDPRCTSRPQTNILAGAFAADVFANIGWAKAAWERPDGAHKIRKITFILLDVLAAHKKRHLIR